MTALDFPVTEEKNRQLRDRMRELDIREADIEEKFVRSSGHGGSNLNKTSTCVYLRHRPTGIEVKCMKDRSQPMNRFFARRELIEKIERARGIATGGDLEREKIRKQKAKRKKRTKTRDRRTPDIPCGPE